jgi:hypothetical protein
MNLPGARYRMLATRCRQSAAATLSPEGRTALLRMAFDYEQRAMAIEIERERRSYFQEQV